MVRDYNTGPCRYNRDDLEQFPDSLFPQTNIGEAVRREEGTIIYQYT